MASTYVDVRKTRTSESFNVKSSLLGLDMETQVDNLNKLYDGKLKFKIGENLYSRNKVIELCYVNENIRILELPEVDNLEIGYVNRYYNFKHSGNTVGTLKIPKTMKELRWSDISQFHNLTSLWVWDTTELIGEKSTWNNVKMLMVQSTKGGKTQVYRF